MTTGGCGDCGDCGAVRQSDKHDAAAAPRAMGALICEAANAEGKKQKRLPPPPPPHTAESATAWCRGGDGRGLQPTAITAGSGRQSRGGAR